MPTVSGQSEKDCLKYCRHSNWITIENIKGNYIKANEHLIFKVADKAVTELQYLFRNMTRLTENCNETVH